ncbi:MAG: hypothetical protein JSS86_08165 [Cyanobacteria bacterium SZAS LIN-2]|nr:hypothetical protein [Cyanobacteria bacterium SZAS LIN-3]MBS1996269.1 hypothetical protein [Cyanobacteria bacterium SZAS LIN-2]
MSKKSSRTGQLDSSNLGPANPTAIRVGELLVEAGIVSSAEMIEAIQVSKRLGVPIGRVLTMSGCVRESVLEAALQVQQLIRHEEVPLQAGINSLSRANEMKISLIDALAEEDLQPDLEHDPHKLAELLVDSNIVSAEEMERAVLVSVEKGVPLGSTLVMQGFMSEQVLPSLVRIQRQISEGGLSREDGLKEIQETFVLWVKADESLKKPLEIDEPVSSDQLKTGSYSTPSPAPVPAERAAAAPAPAPAERTVENAPAQSSASQDVSTVRLVDLLKQAGIFSQADVQQRYDQMLKDPVRSARFFLELGLVQDEDIKGALRTHSLMQRGHLTREEAALALSQARATDFERELDAGAAGQLPDNVRRYTDKRWRGQMGKVLGGALLGAVVAGITMGRKK